MHPYRVAAFAVLACFLSIASDVRAGTLPLAPITSGTDWSFERFMRDVGNNGVESVDKHTVDIDGKAVKMTGTRGISRAALARGIARGAAAGVGGIAIAIAMDAAWCKYTVGTFTCDPMQAKTPEAVVRFGFCAYTSNCYTFDSLPAAFAARHPTPSTGFIKPYIVSYTQSPATTCLVGGSGNHSNCIAYNVRYMAGSVLGPSESTENFQSIGTFEYACPAVAGVAGYGERGGAPVGVEQKCPTGMQGAVSEGDAPARLVEHIPPDKQVEIAEELKKKIDLAPLAGPQVASGPMTLGGTSVVRTRTTALGEAESVLEWSKTDITYGGNGYTTTKTKTTTVTDPVTGEVISEETATEVREGAEDTPGMCDLYPNVVACAKVDAVEVDPLPEVNREVTFAPASGFGPDSGSCPPDQTASFLGQPITWSYAPMCQFAGGIRFVVIALAALLGGMIVMGAARSEG